ncbi:hypothetical protein ATANTOWER_007915, partial [Ataeniobius toweri]|nr:hypothetical protein [Ataeniobius toweri]
VYSEMLELYKKTSCPSLLSAVFFSAKLPLLGEHVASKQMHNQLVFVKVHSGFHLATRGIG